VTELDLWQAAQWALDHHGDGAAEWIAGRIKNLAAAGDVEGAQAWAAVLFKLDELQQTSPAEDQVVH
jgi:hypothetical protein